ncbi:MAG: hypothetical protein ACR2LK_08985 [Solirubrobacteraceae bacterium]
MPALVVIGAAGCGSDDTASKTVTVPAETVTVAEAAPAAPTPTESAEPSDADGQTESAGPPLPAGVVGIDGRYLLEVVKSDADRFVSSDLVFGEERSVNTTTKCAGASCSVAFRFGLRSGGFKPYSLAADPDREGTYVGTGKGQAECPDSETVPSRQRIAVRGGSVKDIGGRKVAGRLSVFITNTLRCDGELKKKIDLLRGPRQP